MWAFAYNFLLPQTSMKKRKFLLICFETLYVLFIFAQGDYSLPPPTSFICLSLFTNHHAGAIVLSNQNLIRLLSNTSILQSDWL